MGLSPLRCSTAAGGSILAPPGPPWATPLKRSAAKGGGRRADLTAVQRARLVDRGGSGLGDVGWGGPGELGEAVEEGAPAGPEGVLRGGGGLAGETGLRPPCR